MQKISCLVQCWSKRLPERSLHQASYKLQWRFYGFVWVFSFFFLIRHVYPQAKGHGDLLFSVAAGFYDWKEGFLSLKILSKSFKWFLRLPKKMAMEYNGCLWVDRTVMLLGCVAIPFSNYPDWANHCYSAELKFGWWTHSIFSAGVNRGVP